MDTSHSRTWLDALSTTLGEDISRRAVLRRVATGGLVVGLMGDRVRMSARAMAQEATPSPTAGPSIHRYTVGEITVRVFDDGSYSVPGPFFAINAPPSEYAAVLAEIGQSMEALTTRSLVILIETGDQMVLIDTGGKGLSPDAGQLPAGLQAEGIAPGDIDIVVMSHLHADHFLGALDEAGKPFFPNARFLINRAEYEFWWAEPSLIDLPLPEEFKTIFREGAKGALVGLQGVIEQIEPETEVAPGVKVIAAYGHTPGHLAIEVASGGETMLHVVDAVGDPAIHLAHPDWFFAPDNWPAFEILTRRALFDRAADENLLVQTYHFPFPGVGRVTKDGDGWLWDPAS